MPKKKTNKATRHDDIALEEDDPEGLFDEDEVEVEEEEEDLIDEDAEELEEEEDEFEDAEGEDEEIDDEDFEEEEEAPKPKKKAAKPKPAAKTPAKKPAAKAKPKKTSSRAVQVEALEDDVKKLNDAKAATSQAIAEAKSKKNGLSDKSKNYFKKFCDYLDTLDAEKDTDLIIDNIAAAQIRAIELSEYLAKTRDAFKKLDEKTKELKTIQDKAAKLARQKKK